MDEKRVGGERREGEGTRERGEEGDRDMCLDCFKICFFYFNYVYICICLCSHKCSCPVSERVRSLELQLHLVRRPLASVLGPELQSSVRAVCP